MKTVYLWVKLKKSMKLNIVVIILLLTCLLEGQSFGKKVQVNTETNYIVGSDKPYNTLKPGDTILLLAGSRPYIYLKEVKGSAGHPIIVMNGGGVVTINTDHYYGVKIAGCRYLRFTGTGDPKHFYGFAISRVANGAGVSIGDLSSDIELDHCYIGHTKIQGLFAKTDPDCSLVSARNKFTQYNTIIHDNYLDYTGMEGMYIGSSFYTGETFKCHGKDTVIFPSDLVGVHVYNNIVNHSGWDGIQVGCAVKDCSIHNNIIMYDSQAGVPDQMSGIMFGGGTYADVYSNYIAYGKGDGIDCFGLGGRIYNNMIINPGYKYYPGNKSYPKHGIYVGDATVVPGNSFHILFNDIINPKDAGINFASIKSVRDLIANNVVINPGGGSGRYIVTSSINATEKNNFLSMKIADAGFTADTTYRLLKTSKLIDAGYPDSKGITTDYFGHPRPQGKGFDIGAVEFGASK
jgi:hypothetical protein